MARIRPLSPNSFICHRYTAVQCPAPMSKDEVRPAGILAWKVNRGCADPVTGRNRVLLFHNSTHNLRVPDVSPCGWAPPRRNHFSTDHGVSRATRRAFLHTVMRKALDESKILTIPSRFRRRACNDGKSRHTSLCRSIGQTREWIELKLYRGSERGIRKLWNSQICERVLAEGLYWRDHYVTSIRSGFSVLALLFSGAL